jgi:hypothetical protein
VQLKHILKLPEQVPIFHVVPSQVVIVDAVALELLTPLCHAVNCPALVQLLTAATELDCKLVVVMTTSEDNSCVALARTTLVWKEFQSLHPVE